MQLNVPPDLETFIKKRLSSGGHVSAEDVLRRALEAQDAEESWTDEEWRVAFAFDPRRHAILLVAGDKSGGSEKRFYRELVRKVDDRLDAHVGRLRKEGR